MSGKRYFTRDTTPTNSYTLTSGKEVRIFGGNLHIYNSHGELVTFLSVDEAIGLGMIAQQMPGHVVTRGGARRT